jgi:hypothetical protein
MRSGTPRAVAELLVNAIPHLGDRLREQQIRSAWAAMVGADAARRTQPQALADGCLSVLVDNSPWLHELTLRAEELTRRTHERFPEVRSLRFVLGTLPPADAARPLRERGRSSVPLDDAARAAIDEAASVIHDETLADAARRLLAKAWRFPRERGAAR